MKILRLLPFFLLLLLAACRSSQSAVEGGAKDKDRSEDTFVKKIVANSQQEKCVTARMSLDLDVLDKAVSVGGKLRMRRDEVIQLSLSVLGFEVGRLEFSPAQVLILDRVNKQYVRASYGDISFLREARLDFYAVQSLFWNEMFVPGEQKVAGQLSRFRYEDMGGQAQLSLTDSPKLDYSFLARIPQAVIDQVVVQDKHRNGVKLDWTYDNFMQLDKRLFPSVMRCEVTGLSKPVGFTLSLSRLDNDSNWASFTPLSSRYKERKVEDILMQLLGN